MSQPFWGGLLGVAFWGESGELQSRNFTAKDAKSAKENLETATFHGIFCLALLAVPFVFPDFAILLLGRMP